MLNKYTQVNEGMYHQQKVGSQHSHQRFFKKVGDCDGVLMGW